MLKFKTSSQNPTPEILLLLTVPGRKLAGLPRHRIFLINRSQLRLIPYFKTRVYYKTKNMLIIEGLENREIHKEEN